jgi:glycosyltransferase involved in cell wall biosynthesis
MKKVLLIAYYFPPDSAVGGMRISKFARHLPSYGWEPTILTIKDRYRKQFDKELADDLRSTTILQTVKLPKLTDLLLSIKRIALVMIGIRKSKDQTGYRNTFQDEFDPVESETFFQKIRRYCLSLSYLPDGERNWVIPATIRTIIEIKRRQIDCIMTSSPPHSSHMIGLIASKLTHVKWVADFRDPWIELLPHTTPLLRTKLTDKIAQWMEQQVIQNADTIMFTTDEHRKVVMERFPREPAEKFLYIPNGIDTEIYKSKNPSERYDKYTISYLGTFYLERSPEPLFKAIYKLISSGMIDSSQININLFGNCGLLNGNPTSSMIHAYGLDSIVKVSEPVPLSEARLIMQRSHLLLLLATPLQHINIPAKIYDYFASGTNILAITEPGATSALIKNTNSGISFSPTDVDGIANYVFMQMRNENRNRVRNIPMDYSLFDAKRLSGQLAHQLFLLTGNHKYDLNIE